MITSCTKGWNLSWTQVSPCWKSCAFQQKYKHNGWTTARRHITQVTLAIACLGFAQTCGESWWVAWQCNDDIFIILSDCDDTVVLDIKWQLFALFSILFMIYSVDFLNQFFNWDSMPAGMGTTAWTKGRAASSSLLKLPPWSGCTTWQRYPWVIFLWNFIFNLTEYYSVPSWKWPSSSTHFMLLFNSLWGWSLETAGKNHSRLFSTIEKWLDHNYCNVVKLLDGSGGWDWLIDQKTEGQ